MYTNKIFSILLLALSTLTLNVKTQTPPVVIKLSGNWPPVNAPPPPVAEWTALVNQNKLPKAPLRPPGTPCAPVDTFCVWPCTNCLRPESDFSFCPNQKEWALTYDDGPTLNSLKVLDALDARGLKATFFVIGSNVIQNPDILKQIVDSGHQIGVHTWSHTALTSQTTEQIIAETKWTELAIQQAVGLTPKWFRPPQGDCDDRVRSILTQLGYKVAFWDRDTFDWQSNSDPNYDLQWIPGNFSIWVQNTTSPNGFASLEHDAFNLSSSMTSLGMDIVTKANFVPQSVSVCLGDNQPYVENVVLPKSSLVGAALSTNNNNSMTGDSKSYPTSLSSGSSIQINVQLSLVCGLIMVVSGLFRTVY